MSQIILTRGLPGSGKTTWAMSWLDQAPICRGRANRDDIRAMIFDQPSYTYQQEEIVTRIQRNTVRELLKSGRDVVIDDTNLRPKYIREWARFAEANHARVDVVDFPIPLGMCILRDAARENPVGASVIERMAAKYMPNGQFLPWETDRRDTAPPEIYAPDESKPKAVIVDIDGTVALMGDRNPYDLKRVFEDAPNERVIESVRTAACAGYKVIYCSGRDESARLDTVAWMMRHKLPTNGPLLMRSLGDRRKDSIVKREIFDFYIRPSFNVRWVYDDRQQVVDMWRELGLTVFQVAEGDF